VPQSNNLRSNATTIDLAKCMVSSAQIQQVNLNLEERNRFTSELNLELLNTSRAKLRERRDPIKVLDPVTS
jgi:hypothetical protein